MPASLAPVAALPVAVFLTQMRNALTNRLAPVSGQLEGLPTSLIGLLGTAYSLGFALGCFLWPLARRAGTFGRLPPERRSRRPACSLCPCCRTRSCGRSCGR